MKKIILVLILLWFATCFIAVREYRELKVSAVNDINYLQKENYFSPYREAIISLNTPNISKVTQVSTASIYFCLINKKNEDIFNKLNSKSPICTNWTTKTKGMYKKYFSEIINIDTSKEIGCTMQGLEIVNQICLN